MIDLRLGDCLDMLAKVADKSIQTIITSPPYNCRKPYESFADEMPWQEYYKWINSIIRECYRTLTDGGTIAINVPSVMRWQSEHAFCDTWSDYDKDYKTHRNGTKSTGKGRIEPIGFEILEMMRSIDNHIREPIIWVKGKENNIIGGNYQMGADNDPYLRSSYEFILLGSKNRWFHSGKTGRRGGDYVPFSDDTKDVWFINPVNRKDHPAIFPVEIPERILGLFTIPGDTILDPFMGSGTTGVACVQTGRNFIGIELEPKYYEIAQRRIAEAQAQLALPGVTA